MYRGGQGTRGGGRARRGRRWSAGGRASGLLLLRRHAGRVWVELFSRHGAKVERPGGAGTVRSLSKRRLLLRALLLLRRKGGALLRRGAGPPVQVFDWAVADEVRPALRQAGGRRVAEAGAGWVGTRLGRRRRRRRSTDHAVQCSSSPGGSTGSSPRKPLRTRGRISASTTAGTLRASAVCGRGRGAAGRRGGGGAAAVGLRGAAQEMRWIGAERVLDGAAGQGAGKQEGRSGRGRSEGAGSGTGAAGSTGKGDSQGAACGQSARGGAAGRVAPPRAASVPDAAARHGVGAAKRAQLLGRGVAQVGRPAGRHQLCNHNRLCIVPQQHLRRAGQGRAETQPWVGRTGRRAAGMGGVDRAGPAPALPR